MITSTSELARAIRSKCSAYTIEEIMSSPSLCPYINSILIAMCERLGRIPNLVVEYLPSSDITAYTDGLKIVANSATAAISGISQIDKQFVALFGLITHECGHVLYTDFASLNPVIEAWQFGTIKGDIPDIDKAQEFLDYLKDNRNYRDYYYKSMKLIQNIIEDIYIENRIYDDFSGLCTLGLKVLRDEAFRLSDEVSVIIDNILNGKASLFELAGYILLLEGHGYKLKVNEALTQDQEAILDYVRNVLFLASVELDILCISPIPEIRVKMLNRLFIKLKDLLPTKDDKSDEKSRDSNDSDSSDNKQDGQGQGKNPIPQYSNNTDFEKMDDSLAGQTTQPIGRQKAINQNFDEFQSNEHKDEANNQSTDKAISNQFEKAIKDFAKEEILSDEESKHLLELRDEAKDILKNSNQRGVCYFDDYVINRLNHQKSHNATYKNEYNTIYKEVEKTSKSLARKLNEILKDSCLEEDETSGYYYGNRFDNKSLLRNDHKHYSRQNMPDEEKTVAFGLLIDESGSMGGEKIKRAKKVAILLDDTLSRIGVKHLIYGHTTSYFEGDKVIMDIYCDDKTIDSNDKYRLASINAGGGNVDGAAITYTFKKLQKMPQDKKVLIVISDGMPCGGSFYYHHPDEDTKKAILTARKQGIEVFGAVVDDYESIKKLYGEKYCFDCRSYAELEKRICMLVKKYVINT